MATVRFKSTVKDNILNQIKNGLDAGSGAATIKIYTGTMPATPETAISTQTLLGTLTCSDPSGSVSSGVLTFSAITSDSSADATGTATWARIADSDGNAIIDVDVTSTAGSGAIKLNTTSIVIGGPLAISSFTISVA